MTAPSANCSATHWDFDVTEQVAADDYGPVSFDYTYHVGESFNDVPASYMFYAYFETLLHSGVTAGCTASTYCPNNNVTRAQMVKFLANAWQFEL
ncbi:MAG: hypothetical protein A2Y62_08055 [Candidatus Fischerbacteria bacterium RBG_13_37_8]|uniref:SLH domain-containing protein n=1 Tax=Candidatus Fischerbacteria bacterium RBG_13_37_8 TaxID=1817863 RepID=A0A1F5V5Q3_9BACT|nr:MAG: hypothetical protein A2Y62_08055 [Candidatus Fischerbacteria bacterium RBG_13_37_8]